MAHSIAAECVVGIYQGSAEMGPRALGNRSIIANPRYARTRAVINERVKFREKIRPLAPMMTLEAARRYYVLPEGVSDADYNGLSWMTVTVRAKPQAFNDIPAVIHHDGTSRVQIVRASENPLVHRFLKLLGASIGVEVAVNTSLNVGSPIVQTPAQAVDALRKSKALDGLFMLSAEGNAYVVWDLATTNLKDGGQRMQKVLREFASV